MRYYCSVFGYNALAFTITRVMAAAARVRLLGSHFAIPYNQHYQHLMMMMMMMNAPRVSKQDQIRLNERTRQKETITSIRGLNHQIKHVRPTSTSRFRAIVNRLRLFI
jgi:hypothetical protein